MHILFLYTVIMVLFALEVFSEEIDVPCLWDLLSISLLGSFCYG